MPRAHHSRRRIAQLVNQHASDQQRLKHQQARIGELEIEVKRLKDRPVIARAYEATGNSAAIYEHAYRAQRQQRVSKGIPE